MATNDLQNEILLSWVQSVEAYLNINLFKWLGVNKNMANVSFYCDETQCPLLIHGLVTKFNSRKVGELLQLQQSED